MKPVDAVMIVAIFVWTTSGCSLAPRPQPGTPPVPGRRMARPAHRQPEYGWEFYNAGTDTLAWVKMNYSANGLDLGFDPGILSSHNPSGWSPAFDPIADSVLIRWKDKSDTWHEQHLVVAPNIPDLPHFTGDVWLVFDGRRWGMTTLTKDQTMALAKAKVDILPDLSRLKFDAPPSTQPWGNLQGVGSH